MSLFAAISIPLYFIFNPAMGLAKEKFHSGDAMRILLLPMHTIPEASAGDFMGSYPFLPHSLCPHCAPILIPVVYFHAKICPLTSFYLISADIFLKNLT